MDGDVAWDRTRWREVYREASTQDLQQPRNVAKELPGARRTGSIENDQQLQSLPSGRASSHTPVGRMKLEQLPSPTASRHPSNAWRDSAGLYGRQQSQVLGSMYRQHDAAHTTSVQLGDHWPGLPSDNFRHPTSGTSRIADASLSLQYPASKGTFKRC